jgi:F-type H+-transporting ATPase subunit b
MTGHEVHHPSVTELIQPAINFALFTGLMVYALRTPLRDYFRERTARIREALEAGRKAKSDAEALRAQLERDIADLPNIVSRMVAELRDTAERQRDLLMRQAREGADRLRSDARMAAEQEAASARSELRALVVDRVVAEASRLVREGVTAADQQRFVDEFGQAARAS